MKGDARALNVFIIVAVRLGLEVAAVGIASAIKILSLNGNNGTLIASSGARRQCKARSF
jgi:hypothetical protein